MNIAHFIKCGILAKLFILISFSQIFAQTGSIKGIVKEKGGETIIGANVIIAGTTTGTTTNLDGFYEIKGLEPGSYTIQISFISYETVILENIIVSAGKSTEKNVDLEQITQMLQTVDIMARLQKEKESILLLEQKKSKEIVQHIGAQELSRKGVSDVATAVTKVSGISKVEGSNDIYVRGLGDRYNSTQMNGLPMPSNNPEQKNISLDIFTIDIVEFIKIDKVYNNRIYGDFAGGNVDINSREFTGDRLLRVDFGTNFNFNAIDHDKFPIKAVPDLLGFSRINAPTTLERFEFETNWNPQYVRPVANSFGISAGNVFKIGKNKNREINFFTTVNFSNDISVKDGLAFGTVNSAGVPRKSFVMKSYSYCTNTTAMLNLNYKFNKNHKLNYNMVFINSSENSNEEYRGTIIDIADYNNGFMFRKTYEQNTLFINQLLGKHSLGLRSEFNWGASYNIVTSNSPDRLQNTFRMVDGNYYFGQNQITDNHRYFHKLEENEKALNMAYSWKLLSESAAEYKLKFTLGTSSRYKTIDFEATQYNFRILQAARNMIVAPNNLDDFFNQQNLENNYFRIETFRGSYQVPNALDPQVYGGTQLVQGTFLTTEYRISNKLTALIGLRAEYVSQEITWNTQLDPSDRSDWFEFFDFLPNLITKYELTKKQNLRFAVSKTYTLPQFKERAMFIYEDVTEVKLGNPDLYHSENYNLDLKWELFPKTGEIISVGIFGKYILNPINEFAITSATNDISFLNTGNWGYVSGIEFEIRKDIVSKNNYKISFGFNTSYMHTEQELNSEKVKEETIYEVNFTHERARFTGASDLLVNSDISFQRSWNENKNLFTLTASYSYFSDRIYAVGTNTRGNIIESPFHSFDAIFKVNFNNLGIGFTVKNIINPPIERYQANANQDVLVLSYKKGTVAGINISYKF